MKNECEFLIFRQAKNGLIGQNGPYFSNSIFHFTWNHVVFDDS